MPLLALGNHQTTDMYVHHYMYIGIPNTYDDNVRDCTSGLNGAANQLLSLSEKCTCRHVVCTCTLFRLQ